MVSQIMYHIIITFFFFLPIQNVNAISRIDTNVSTVNTKVGLIRGQKSADGNYYMYMGIPYALVDPKNPFGAAIPHPIFDEVFNAYSDSDICAQFLKFNKSIAGTYDCLQINIYVPISASSTNRIAVLTWIHGGAYSQGFANRHRYGPSFLVQHDIILVTINYRLGPYGFLCLDIPEVPGNQGLKDQELALKWIKTNIDAFGGDSNKITLAGNSVGAEAVDLHLIFNKENFFNQVILQSGSAMDPMIVKDSDLSIPLKIANHLGFSTNDVKEALSFLSTISSHSVIAASIDLDISYRPCVEKYFEGVERFIAVHPFKADTLRVQNFPILIGYTNDERLYMKPSITIDIFRKHLQRFFNFEPDQLTQMERIVRNFYIGYDNITDQSIWSAINFESDLMTVYPTNRSIHKYFRGGAKSIYQYVFSYKGGRNMATRRYNITEGGVTHADELGYLFDISYMKGERLPEDQLIINKMTKLWANFVKYGNPTPEKTELLPVTWIPNTEEPFYLNIDTELSLERRPFHERMAFWDVFYQLNNRSQEAYRDEL